MADTRAFLSANASRDTILPPYPGPRASSPGNNDRPVFDQPTSYTQTSPEKTYIARQQRTIGFFRQHAGVWRALPAVLGVIIWCAQMIYFLFWFLSRPPQEDGSWARIGVSYAAWPFISCIGAERQLCFKATSVIVASLLWTAFGIDYVVGRRAPVGRWLRLAKLVFSSISSVFLIALSFSSVATDRKIHLIFTSFQIILMAMAKVADWHLNRLMREWLPTNRPLQVSKAWKRIAASVALPAGILVMCGIYGCTAKVMNGVMIFTSQCWSLVSFAATAEWTLAIMWMIFVGTVAYDNYYLEDTVRLLLSTPPPPKQKGFGLTFWRRWTEKRGASGHNLDSWQERRGLRETADTEDLEQYAKSISQQYSGADNIDSQTAEEPYSPLGDIGRTWMPSKPNTAGSSLSSRGYQQISSSPRLENS